MNAFHCFASSTLAAVTRREGPTEPSSHRLARLFLTVALTMSALHFGSVSASAATVSNLDFNVDNVLPSSQGWTYAGNLVETSVYTVSGGLLHMNTQGQGVGNYAEYRRPDGNYDVNLDLFFEFRAQFLDVAPSSERHPFFGIGVNDRVGPDGGSIYAYFSPHSIWFFNDNTRVAYNPVDGLAHTYLLTASGSTHTFQFSVDGVNIKSGIVGPPDTPYPASVFFSDDSTGDDAARVDVDYVHFRNGTSVPEPPTVVLLGIVGLAFGASVVWRSGARRTM